MVMSRRTIAWLISLYLMPIVPVFLLAHHLEEPEDRWTREAIEANVAISVMWPVTTVVAAVFMLEDYLDG